VLGVPALGVPVLGVPVLGVPVLGVPVRGVPVLGVPVLGVPVLEVPVLEVPALGVSAPEVPALGVSAPEVPALGVPVHEAPVLGVPVPEVPVLKAPVVGTLVAVGTARAVAEGFGTAPDGLGLAPAEPAGTGGTVAEHPELDVGCGAALRGWPTAVAGPCWSSCQLPDVALPAADELPPPLIGVPLPSGPVLPCVGPLPPSSEVLAWRIAWRTG